MVSIIVLVSTVVAPGGGQGAGKVDA
jgi:hypothetical protein